MKSALPEPGPDCARFADLLPLSAPNLLTGEQAESLQAHLRDCRHCQAKLDMYARLDDALRSYLAAGDGATDGVNSHADAYPGPQIIHMATWAPTLRSTFAALVAAVLVAGLLGAVLLNRGTSGPGRTTSPSPAPSASASTASASTVAIGLSALDMRTPRDGWAAGWVATTSPDVSNSSSPTPADGPPQQAQAEFFLHYNGTAWKEFPVAPNLSISSISMISASDGWAVGSDVSGTAVILRYQSGEWGIVAYYDPPDGRQYSLQSIAMVNADTGWIVGSSTLNYVDQRPVLLGYQQGQWRPVALTDAADAYELNAVTMYSATEGWAVGTANNPSNQQSAYILHYHNGIWQRVGVGLPGLLYDVTEVAPGNVWAVGSGTSTSASGSVVLHYQAGNWQRVTVPTPNILQTVAFSSPTSGWIGGDEGVMLHYNGSSWSNSGIVWQGLEIEQVCAVASGDAWAIGTYLVENSATDLTVSLLHYSGGAWRVYPLTNVIAVPQPGRAKWQQLDNIA